MSDDTWQLPEDQRPPPEVTAALFAELRTARRGVGNPSDDTNPLWAWLAAHPDINAYQVAWHFDARRMGPATWTNARFGQSCTPLPDGRVVRIAGEHEDYYDPDFFIYNDVQITAPDGATTIFGYAPEAFPPTDFHSATLVGDDVFVIGNLGYQTDRRHGTTPVFRLDTRTFAFAPLVAAGEAPGWLHSHRASSDGERIFIAGGLREVTFGARVVLVDNGDDYCLDLGARRWTRTTDRQWREWELVREDGTRGMLWHVGQLAYYRGLAADDAWAQDGRERTAAHLGFEPDLAAWEARFTPPLPAELLPQPSSDDDPGAWRFHRRMVDGVTVRYVDDDPVRVIVEGPLAASTVAILLDDLAAKLSRVEHTRYRAVPLGPW